jgi:hypothetical protein
MRGRRRRRRNARRVQAGRPKAGGVGEDRLAYQEYDDYPELVRHNEHDGEANAEKRCD